ncbi:hypothetical protein C0J52_17350 [Blattella germanica]|nr:hypothetical protein C0J52_17350 [Blattella germanica]
MPCRRAPSMERLRSAVALKAAGRSVESQATHTLDSGRLAAKSSGEVREWPKLLCTPNLSAATEDRGDIFIPLPPP